ncbi:MAG: TRAP transporter fused permease subunit [Alphaproteobacteria bacterium]|jgi:TRAP transporter 4TM/12TM fusion protein|nr:TRAP transporter fused permease subunit [Alphaproteobacteria bacterium]
MADNREDDANGLESAAIESSPRRGGALVYWITITLGVLGVGAAINQSFGINPAGFILIDNAYYYLLIAIFLSLSFLLFPAIKRHEKRVPVYDWVLFVGTLYVGLYHAYYGGEIIERGWDTVAPLEPTLMAAALCLLALEGVRRAGGLALFAVCIIFFTFPLWAEQAPGFLWGVGKTPTELVRAYAMGFESIVGLPMRVAGNILIGFLIFGAALVVTGGGAFFMNFAAAILGRSRGGPAKVAVLASGFFGSLSGSVISNVVTTGRLTIPTMKRAGYSAPYAGAVEACASTGGTLMPPVMGAVAFIMAEFLNIPYSDIVIAAAVPSILFYAALLLQVDCHAAVHGLKGQPAEDIPSLIATLKEGWFYLLSLVVLVYFLVFARLEIYAPYFATIILVASAALFRKNARFGFKQFLALIEESTRTISNIVAILAGVGVIVGSLAFTGVGGAFSRELVGFAQGSLWLLLAMGAITSFVLGMGVTVSACYIFLAIVLGPALIEFGIDPVASHLFILYWGMLSYITPPVALAAVAASVIAGSKQMETAITAMRLGSIKFVLPFILVLTPALILRGEDVGEIVAVIAACSLAIVLLAAGFEGYLYGVGRIGFFIRLAIFICAAGLLYQDYRSWIAAVVGMVLVYLIAWQTRTRRAL